MSGEVLIGTQSGPFVTPSGTLPPSGRAIRMPFVTVQQVRDGKIAAERIYFDQLDLLEQFGRLARASACLDAPDIDRHQRDRALNYVPMQHHENDGGQPGHQTMPTISAPSTRPSLSVAA